ncbi:MAG: FAD-dependent oxidoreductase, partial [bacterium]|nr:FAD-dependent oxidoreductase [bacterium]
MHKIVVIGAGISGLAAAWTASRRAADAGLEAEVVVLEKDPEVGGKARTLDIDGFQVEAGPTGFMGGESALDQLVEEAGLGGERIRANKSAERRFVVRNGRLRELKAHPLKF